MAMLAVGLLLLAGLFCCCFMCAGGLYVVHYLRDEPTRGRGTPASATAAPDSSGKPGLYDA